MSNVETATTNYETTPQLRSAPLVDLEIASDGSEFSGYAAVFDEVAELGDFTESVARGAFRKVLAASRNIPMLWNHNPDMPLAMTKAGTLTLSEDMEGLRVEARLGRTSWADNLRDMIDRDEVGGMSYGFVAGPGNSRIEQRGGRVHRTLLGFTRLLDVSPTWDPAYAGTSAELRAALSATVLPQEIAMGIGEQLGEAAEGSDTDDAEEEHEARTAGQGSELETPNLAAVRMRLSIIRTYEKGFR